ncbi:MAG: glycosyltransferase [Clostridia bacterium]
MNNQSNPKLSIVTPTYNRENYLRETIDSVLKQSFTDYEYIIVDDGSMDHTQELVEGYHDPRIQYVYQENGGDTSAVNHGWRLAKGDYFIQINSDDPILPGLFETMCSTLDQQPDKLVAYCDFVHINENGDNLSVLKLPEWDFLRDLKAFNCYPCAPGTFIRKKALPHWKHMRQYEGYKCSNDAVMIWDLALEGDFIHVPQVLATFRNHSTQISNEAWLYAPEGERWFQEYFSKPNLPPEVLAAKSDVRASLAIFQENLILNSDLSAEDKFNYLRHYEKERLRGAKEYISLQIGYDDLIGGKSNGYHLHFYLNQNDVRSYAMIRRPKASVDPDTFHIAVQNGSNYAMQILHSQLFHMADVVHLHHIHHTDFDLNLLPVLTQLKPTVLSLHDLFFLGGHCVYPHECEKWKTHCQDCESLNMPFPLYQDETALNFALKKEAFQNSDISMIVASEWMRDQVSQSPIMQGKKVYLLPFGIDQSIYCPKELRTAKTALGINPDALVLMLRTCREDQNALAILKAALAALRCKREVVVLTVGENGLIPEQNERFRLVEHGGIKDEHALAELYQACDLYLSPTHEAFGQMACEAMCCGKMVLATVGSALAETVNAPACGIAVSKEDFAAELQRLAEHSEEIKERGERSLAYAQAHYSLQNYAEGIKAIYQEVMAKHQPSADAELISKQILRYDSVKYPLSDGLSTLFNPMHVLYQSNTWRMTKPLRALSHARRQGKGLKNKLRCYRSYMNNNDSDRQNDVEILNSRSWKLCTSLRFIGKKVHK